ncbi:hypothetical protein F5B17DRAFT_429774 [Nemania serpens]|nr:hypothetical protein F5B17DRAFT_429774 [Nemania serpens]
MHSLALYQITTSSEIASKGHGGGPLTEECVAADMRVSLYQYWRDGLPPSALESPIPIPFPFCDPRKGCWDVTSSCSNRENTAGQFESSSARSAPGSFNYPSGQCLVVAGRAFYEQKVTLAENFLPNIEPVRPL